MDDYLVIGGGVIGLSLAYELAGRGRRVQVIDSGQPGREASWAGAGILPPASAQGEPLEQLTALGNRLHAEWAERLLADTGVDNGFRRCGAIYLARDADEAARLELLALAAAARDIQAERFDGDKLAACEPALRPEPAPLAAFHVPAECQIRNPRHLKALLAGCAARGVQVTPGVAAHDFQLRGGRVQAVCTSAGNLSAGQVCLTTGAWSGAIARRLGCSLAVQPIRGQIVLLTTAGSLLTHIVNEGSRYLVPRPDGRLLVGSTEEDAGFDRSTTARATHDLLALALSLVPQLAEARVEQSWAGLRPATEDGMPYLGRIGELDNAFIAAGHFRSGLQLSTATAVVMSQLMESETPEVELRDFRPDRDAGATPAEERTRAKRPLSLH